MRLVVNLCKVLKIEVSIDLRGRYVRMAEQFLHGSQVAGRFQHMAGKGMP